MDIRMKGLWLPVLVAALGGIVPLQAQGPAPKKPIPDDDSLEQALALVQEVYGDEFELAKDAAKKAALAEKLLQKAKQSAAEPTNQFALLRVAKKIATLAGDADLALRAVDDMALTFLIETFPMRVQTLLKTAGSASQKKQHAVIVTQATTLIDQAAEQDDFDTARTLSQTAIAAARRSGDSALVKNVVARDKEVEDMATAYAEVKGSIAKLKNDPVDPEANLAVGKYRCLLKGEWAKGISNLSLGNDQKLKELATKELKGVSDTNGQVALGDGWWELALTSEGTAQQQLQWRAAYWYRKALPELAGLVKDKVEKRLNDIPGRRPLLAVARGEGADGEAIKGGGPASTEDYSREKIFSRIGEAKRKGAIEETPLFGKQIGRSFQDISDAGGLLVGFNVKTGGHGRGYRLIRVDALQPIFRTTTGFQVGKWHGGGERRPTLGTTQAKAGYVVAGIQVAGTENGGQCDGMRVIFMKMKNGSLDVQDKYVSPWFGKSAADDAPIVGANGKFVIGVKGSYDVKQIRGIGLVLLR